MATSPKPASRPAPRSAARLDASLLLARKGHAMPAVASTQHNNPGLAWGAHPHPQDFQSQNSARPVARAKAVATARLRSDTFVSERTAKANPNPRQHAQSPKDDVALTLRLEDETYLRLKYLAQKSGMSAHKILNEALAFHLVRNGVPRSRKLVIKADK